MVVEKKYDLTIIGGGAAGLASAIRAGELNIDRIALIDSPPYVGKMLGGILPQCIHPGFGLHYFKKDLTGPEFAYRLIERLDKLDIDIFRDTYAYDMKATEDYCKIMTVNSSGITRILSRTVICATGARERNIFEIGVVGSRPAGIFTAGEAQALMDLFGVMPGRNIVIIGSGDIGLIMARRFALEGANVKAVIELMPWPGGLTRNVVQCLEDFNIPLLLSHIALRVLGKNRVEGIEIARVDENLKPIAGTEKIIKCDTVIVSAGIVPRIDLLEKVGALIDKSTNGPIVNDFLETSVPNIFAAGNVLVINDLVDYAAEQGEIAAESAAYIIHGGRIPHKNPIKIVLGKNVRLAVPQLLTGIRDTYIYIRVKKPMKNVYLYLNEIHRKIKLISIRPSEMIRIFLRKEEISRIENKILNINILG